jgi:hypothetical protein
MDLASLIANDFVYRGCVPTITQMRTLLPQILEIVPHTRIVIDGLDECSPEGQRSVLKEIQALISRPEIRCKILVSSRKEVQIRNRLAGKPHFDLDGREEVNHDIRLYIKDHVQKLHAVNKTVLDQVETSLVAKAMGTYRFISSQRI